MNPQEIQNLIQNEVQKQIRTFLAESQFNVAKISSHVHSNTDSQPLNPKDFLGFPTVLKTNASVAPTDTPKNGIIRIQYDSTRWYLWVRVNNLWKSVSLT